MTNLLKTGTDCGYFEYHPTITYSANYKCPHCGYEYCYDTTKPHHRCFKCNVDVDYSNLPKGESTLYVKRGKEYIKIGEKITP